MHMSSCVSFAAWHHSWTFMKHKATPGCQKSCTIYATFFICLIRCVFTFAPILSLWAWLITSTELFDLSQSAVSCQLQSLFLKCPQVPNSAITNQHCYTFTCNKRHSKCISWLDVLLLTNFNRTKLASPFVNLIRKPKGMVWHFEIEEIYNKHMLNRSSRHSEM